MANTKTNSTARGTDNSVAAGSLKTVILSGVAVNFRYVPAGSFQRDRKAANRICHQHGILACGNGDHAGTV